MGLLDWLFGGDKSKDDQQGIAANGEASDISDLDSRFLHIRDRDFFGQFTKSPNGRFTLAWRDGNETVVTNGVAKKISGRYLLLEGDKVLIDRKMTRPNDGKVADNGVFILNDWGKSEALSGTIWAFNAQGEPLLKKRFSANLLNNGLSEDGRLAVCQTCNSPSHDSSILAVFNLVEGTEISRWSPESGWASYYLFPGGDILRLGYRKAGECDYTLDGQLLNREQWEESLLANGDLLFIERVLKDVNNQPEGELLRKLLDGLDVALAVTNAHPHSIALSWKLRGICLEANGALAEALNSYDRALALNPKVGVKQRADRLRKTLAKP